jgi:uncharacterized protein
MIGQAALLFNYNTGNKSLEETMKYRNLILITALSLFIFGCAPAQEIQIVESEERSIYVTGVGEVTFVPDVAEVILGVYTSNRDFGIAQKESDENTKKVLEALMAHNIDEADIQIDYLNINTSPVDNSQSEYQYNVRNNILVTVHDMTKIKSIIEDSLKAGANRVMGIYFRVIGVEIYQEEARKLALEAAKEKAGIMAGQLGQEVGEPLTITEYQYDGSPNTLFVKPYNDYYNTNSYNLNQFNMMLFDEVTIRVSVSVKFSLE